MDGKTPDLLPLSAAKKKIRDGVPLVCAWALINTFSTAVSYVAADYIPVSCSQGNRPLHRDSVLRPIAGGRSGAGAAAPMPSSLGPPSPL
ncbi:unnamed protein product [Triticum turgidum subsp. durum]|uniref:Uncharacterized protein n=1 Tax=Triticum turgidum subsp. durum TaxID=4567 RepID=A0A9R1S4D4_TRITD|nr:unnamed protein product [Triticum turgidum subsp. durum]